MYCDVCCSTARPTRVPDEKSWLTRSPANSNTTQYEQGQGLEVLLRSSVRGTQRTGGEGGAMVSRAASVVMGVVVKGKRNEGLG